ncbi:MAG: hypothetical protein Q9170_002709 [Blastenia crenularia]
MKSSLEEYRLLSDDETGETPSPSSKEKKKACGHHRLIAILWATLSISTCVHIVTAVIFLHFKHAVEPERTDFAKLSWDTPSKFVYNGLYDSPNTTLTNDAWEALNFDPGSIALNDDFVESLGLLKAQRFPWDDTKGLYFLNGYHGVHCLKSLRQGMFELRDRKPMAIPFGHLMHCFESLLDDVMCFADDTPRYTALDHPGKSGLGQRRQCRDWKKLEAFAQKHTSCWRDVNPNENIDTLLRYRYCPKGSPYNDWIKAIFGEFDRGKGASAET